MKFTAFGAADSVGASCYFLQTDGINLLLDCGKGMLGHRTFGPDLTGLFSSGLTSVAQLDAILISHGHYDHIGYLPEFARLCPDTPVYATPVTKKLARYLMQDRYCAADNDSLEQKISAEVGRFQALERIQPQNYLQPIKIGPVSVTFFEAGHVPGAAMVYVESQEGSFLYTGDFRRAASRLTNGYLLPQWVQPDVLLLCGLHAKHPNYRASVGLDGIAAQLNTAVRRRRLITTRELTKGIEIVSFLVEAMKEGKIPQAPVFLDDHIWQLNVRMQEAGLSVLGEQCRRFPQLVYHTDPYPGIYVGGKRYAAFFRTVLDAKFSLHADYAECSGLVEALHPATVILVHSPSDAWGVSGNAALERDHPASAFLYPQIGQAYDLL